MSKDFIKPEIYLIENYPCNSKQELCKRERHYVETIDCVNKYIPSRTKKEYYQDNKDIIIKKNAEYLKKNNIDRREYYREWRKRNVARCRGYKKKKM
jgi:hypothetical protein